MEIAVVSGGRWVAVLVSVTGSGSVMGRWTVPSGSAAVSLVAGVSILGDAFLGVHVGR